MNIIILAAGQGSRLKPYTNNIPKCLVEVAGKSFLARQIEIFESLGFDYQEHLIRKCFEENGSDVNVYLIYTNLIGMNQINFIKQCH